MDLTKEELLKTAKPILFNTEMVKAIQDGRKTVTRRTVKDVDSEYNFCGWITSTTGTKRSIGKAIFHSFYHHAYVRPQYKIDDILYVRETWRMYEKRIGKDGDCHLKQFCAYKADLDNINIQKPAEWYDNIKYKNGLIENSRNKWSPSIHMPKEYARIFLKVIDVRVERLEDITEEQAIKEGFIPLGSKTAKETFLDEIERIYDIRKGYCIAYEFEVLEVE